MTTSRLTRIRLVLVWLGIIIILCAALPTRAVAQQKRVDLVMVVDGSSSIDPEDFELARLFIRQVTASCVLGTDAQVGVVQFSTQGSTRIESRLSSNYNAVNQAILAMQQLNGTTDIQEGLQVGQQLLNGGRTGVEKIIILLTDGAQTDPGNPIDQATQIKTAGTKIFGIAVGAADVPTINEIASDPDKDFVFTVQNFTELSQVLGTLVNASCEVPPITQPPDAPDTTPTPRPSGPEEESDESPFVTVVQRPEPNTIALPGEVLTYTVVAVNWGDGSARDVDIDMPFDPALVSLMDVTFSNNRAWVSRLVSDSLELRTGYLGSGGDMLTATVRFMVLGSEEGIGLGKQLPYRYEGRRGHSNTPIVVGGPNRTHMEYYPLTTSPANGPAGTTHTFSSVIFAPNEPLVFWYNAPDGTVVPAGKLTADAAGSISATFTTDGLTPGTYSMVVRGEWTEFSATGVFSVE